MGSQPSQCSDAKLVKTIKRKLYLHKKKTSGRQTNQELLEEAFFTSDKDNSGSININEFTATAESLGLWENAKIMAMIFNRLDSDKDGWINKLEFLKFMGCHIIENEGKSAKASLAVSKGKKATKKSKGPAVEKPREESVFDREVSRSKMQTTISSTKPKETSEERVQRLLQKEYAIAEGKLNQKNASSLMNERQRQGRKQSDAALEEIQRIELTTKVVASDNTALRAELVETRNALLKALDPVEQQKRYKKKKLSARQERKRLRQLEAIASQNLMSEVVQHTGGNINFDDLQSLREKFLALKVTELDHAQFDGLMCDQYPELKSQPKLLEKLFILFDDNYSGTIEFEEFAVGLAKSSKCTLHEKAKMIFSIVDDNGDGRVSQSELRDMLREGQEDFMEHMQFTTGMFELLDEDNNGKVNAEEFIGMMEANPALMSSFSTVLPFPAAVTNLQSVNEHFNVDQIHKLWKAMGYTGKIEDWQRSTMGEEVTTINAEKFREIMMQHFNCEESMLGFVNQIFRELDKDGSGEVTFPELCHGMLKVLGSPEEQLKFCFGMYDLDKSGRIDVNEVEMMLRGTGKKLQDDTSELEALIRKFDTGDGDGKIDVSEFLALAHAKPELQEGIVRMFSVLST